jgi:hypothetical protein
MVVLAALTSSTLLNCVFPFFTYVESSGLLGEFLPQVAAARLPQLMTNAAMLANIVAACLAVELQQQQCMNSVGCMEGRVAAAGQFVVLYWLSCRPVEPAGREQP